MPRKKKKILFFIILGCFFTIVAGFLIFLIYSKVKAKPYVLDTRRTVTPHNPLFIPHPVFGWSISPGRYTITYQTSKKIKPYSYILENDEEGYRMTSQRPSDYDGKPEIWIFGCSFAWGSAMASEKIYPWLIQEKFQDFKVRNFGIGGYGNVHALLQMRELLKGGSTQARFAVFSYAPFHLPRNTGAPSKLREYAPQRPFMDPRMRHTRAFLNEQGRLAIQLVPFNPGDEEKDPSKEETIKITKAIFDELDQLCRSHHIIPILAVQYGSLEDPIVTHGVKLGFHIADIRVDFYNPEFVCLPYDGHPNAKAHRIYAGGIISLIQRILNGEGKDRAP